MILFVAAVEALTLLVLWTALAGRRVPRLARPFVACGGVSGAFGAWIAVLVVRGPSWMVAVTAGFIALSSAAMALAIHVVTREEEDGGGGGDVGGGRGPVPEPPRDGGGDLEPTWWPEFERQLTSYLASHEREGVAG